MTDPTDAAIAAIDACLAAAQAARAVLVARKDAGGAERYFSADDPGPFRTPRAFLDAARRREFPTMRVGKRVVAKASDVFAAIESKPQRPPRKPKAKDPLAKFERAA